MIIELAFGPNTFYSVLIFLKKKSPESQFRFVAKLYGIVGACKVCQNAKTWSSSGHILKWIFQKIFRMVPVFSESLTRNTDVFTQAILSRYLNGQSAESPVPTRSTLLLERSNQPRLTMATSCSHWLPCKIPQRFPITNIKDKPRQKKDKIQLQFQEPFTVNIKFSGGERAADLPLVLPGSFFFNPHLNKKYLQHFPLLRAPNAYYQVAELGGTLGLFFGFSFISLWDEIILLAALAKKLYKRKQSNIHP